MAVLGAAAAAYAAYFCAPGLASGALLGAEAAGLACLLDPVQRLPDLHPWPLHLLSHAGNQFAHAVHALCSACCWVRSGQVKLCFLGAVRQNHIGIPTQPFERAGLAGAWIGLTVQHCGNHGAMSTRPAVNRALGLCDDLIGGSSLLWQYHHQARCARPGAALLSVRVYRIGFWGCRGALAVLPPLSAQHHDRLCARDCQVPGTVKQDASHQCVVNCTSKQSQGLHAEANAHGRCRTTSTATTTRSMRTCSARTRPCASTRACRAAGSTATSTSTWCALPASGFGVLGWRSYELPAACAETLACRAFVHCYQHTCMAPFTASDS